MEVLHVEDLASHDDPESCVVIRKGRDEALTGESAGRALSRDASRQSTIARACSFSSRWAISGGTD